MLSLHVSKLCVRIRHELGPRDRIELSASVAEECYLLLPGLVLVPGADQESRSEATLQAHHQPTGWLQHVQTAAARGPVTPALYC